MNMESDVISTLTAKIDSFPTLPIVITRVLEITTNPESTADDLLKVISIDQSLTTTILKMANSAFFGLVREVSSLQQALMVLGFTEIRNVVLAKAVFNSFKNLKKDDKFDIRDFWEHSFTCGLAAKVIALDLKEPCNDFFVAGLIHDIGKLVIYMTFPMEFYRIIETLGPLRFKSSQEEKNILGITHDEVGTKLLKRWLFPESLIAAVGLHHCPHKALEQSLFSVVTYIADLLAHMEKLQDDDEVENSIKNECFYPEVVSFFQSRGLDWNESTLKTFRQKVAEQKENDAGTLSLLLS